MKPPIIGWPVWVRTVVAVAALALACPGCTSALEGAVVTLEVSKSGLDLARELVLEACTTERAEAADDSAAYAARCIRVEEAHDLLVASWKIAVQAVPASLDDGELDLDRFKPFLLPFAEAYAELADLVEALTGRTMPPVADLVKELIP